MTISVASWILFSEPCGSIHRNTALYGYGYCYTFSTGLMRVYSYGYSPISPDDPDRSPSERVDHGAELERVIPHLGLAVAAVEAFVGAALLLLLTLPRRDGRPLTQPCLQP